VIQFEISGIGGCQTGNPIKSATKWGIMVDRGMMAGTIPKNKTILIVEDNELNMKLFHDLLEAHGYATLQTKDGNEALKLAREHHPNLILMDVQLPTVSGLDVTRWIKSDASIRHIPVIAVTAFAMKGDEEKILECGCEAYIAKPISIANFMEVIEGTIL
jgi:two-component system cell cycle response regulator DivK